MSDVQLPEPLVPAYVDLSDFPDMPLDVKALRDSRLAAHGDAEAFMCDVLLWCASWHQVPAGSLANDDMELAAKAGYGRVVSEWKRVKDRVLRKWVLCSDNRLYHPVVAKRALIAWAAKSRHRYERMVERARKANRRRQELGHASAGIPAFDEWISGGMREPVPVESGLFPGGNCSNGGGIPPENALIGKVREGKGKELLAAGAADFAEFWSAWPKHQRKADRAKCEAWWQAKFLSAIGAHIVAHVRAMARSEDWTKQGGKFIPAPLVYLHKASYDAPPAPPGRDDGPSLPY